jgi:hypothetical protein
VRLTFSPAGRFERKQYELRSPDIHENTGVGTRHAVSALLLTLAREGVRRAAPFCRAFYMRGKHFYNSEFQTGPSGPDPIYPINPVNPV